MSSKHNTEDWLNDWGDDENGGGGGGGGGWGDGDDLGFDDDMETGPNPYAPSSSSHSNGNGTSGYGSGSGRMVAGGAAAASSSYGRDSSFGASSSGSHKHHVGRSSGGGGYGPVSPGGGGGEYGNGGSPYSDGSDRRRTFLLIGALLVFAIFFATLSSDDGAGGWNDDDAAAAGGDWNPDALSTGGGGNEGAPASSPFDDDAADGGDDNHVEPAGGAGASANAADDDDAIQGDEIHGKGVKIMADARAYAPGRPVTITFEDHSPRPNDWVGLYPWGSAYYDASTQTERLPHPSIDWMYLCGSKECDGSITAGVEGGSVVFDNVAVGRWKVYLIRNGDGGAGYEFVAESEEFEVKEDGGEEEGVGGGGAGDGDATSEPTYLPTSEPTYVPTKEETTDVVEEAGDDDAAQDQEEEEQGTTDDGEGDGGDSIYGGQGSDIVDDDTSAVATLAIPATTYEAGNDVIITLTNPTPDELNWISIGLADVATDNAEGKMVLPDDDSYLDCCWSYGAYFIGMGIFYIWYVSIFIPSSLLLLYQLHYIHNQLSSQQQHAATKIALRRSRVELSALILSRHLPTVKSTEPIS